MPAQANPPPPGLNETLPSVVAQAVHRDPPAPRRHIWSWKYSGGQDVQVLNVPLNIQVAFAVIYLLCISFHSGLVIFSHKQMPQTAFLSL